MPTTFATYDFGGLETAIRGYIADIANVGLSANSDERIKVIPGNSNFNAPTGVYGTLLMITDESTGLSAVRVGEQNDDVRVDRKSTFSLQFYRAGAMAAMMKFTGLMQSDLWVDRAAARGFRIEWNGNIRRVDDFVESFREQFEERVVVDLTVEYMQYSHVDSGRIDVVPVTTNSETQNVGE